MTCRNAKYLVASCMIGAAVMIAPVMAASEDAATSDLWAKAALATTYTLNRHLNPFDIDTEINNGVATLRGSVESDIERDLAEELALGVDGIKEVKNELKVDAAASRKRDRDDPENTERSFMRKVEDANTTAKIKSQLLWNGNTSGLSIDVDTRSGVVTLKGQVDSQVEADLAAQIARNTDDVRSVKNQLVVNADKTSIADKAAREASQVGQQVSDGWITTKVKSALIYNRNVDGTDIDVETKNGVVTLRGNVDSEFERKQAIAIAGSVKGVKSTKSELQGG